jgi:hypothetical protein
MHVASEDTRSRLLGDEDLSGPRLIERLVFPLGHRVSTRSTAVWGLSSSDDPDARSDSSRLLVFPRK